MRLCRDLAGIGRLVAAPGREIAPEKLAGLVSLAFGGDTTTGPPNLLLIVIHRSGRRAEKLDCVRVEKPRKSEINLQRANNFHAKVAKNVISMLR